MEFQAQERFHDRAEAGAALAERLSSYRGLHALVLGIPRGGIPVAAELARRLEAELDVVVAHKIGAPGQEELAIGAVTADGERWLNRELVEALGIDDAYVEREAARWQEASRERERRLRSGGRRGARPAGKAADAPEAPAPIEGRVVLVIDDGLATGATMLAALRSVRRKRPARLIAAVPVAPLSSVELLRTEADEVVCLRTPEPFLAVGFHYEVFDQVSDEEVAELLRHRGRVGGAR